MRAVAAVLVLLAACHPPSLRDRAVQLGHKVAHIGSSVHLKIDTQAMASTAANVAIARAANSDGVARAAASSDEVPAGDVFQPAPTSHPSTFVAQWGAGCTRHGSLAECEKDCKDRFDIALKMGAGTQCSCVADAPCN